MMFLFIFLSLVFLYSKVSKRSFEIAAPTVFFFIAICVYFSGLVFSSFTYGNIFIILLSSVSLIFLFYDIFKNKRNWIEILKEFKALIVLYIIMAVLLIGFKSRIWDDFSHWMLTVKNMFLFNELSNNEKSTIFFKTYPPATAIIQYFYSFIENIVFKNINLEYNSQLVTNYFVMILLLSMTNMRQLNNKAKRILYPVLFLIPAIFNEEVYLSLYVDIILAIMGVYLISCYEYSKNQKTGKKFVFLDMALATLFLVLIKSTGTAIIVFCLIYIILDLIFSKKYKSGIQIIVTILVSLLIGKTSWEYYIHKTKADIIWKTENITFKNILDIFNKKGQEYQYQTINNFFKALVKTKIGLFSYAIFFVLIAGILLFIYLKAKNSKNLKLLIYNISIIVLYPISLLIMYIFIFSVEESLNLASFNRYLSTVVVFLLILNILLLIKENWILKYSKIIVIMFLILFFNNSTIKKLTIKKRKDIKTVKEERGEIIKIPDEITNNHNNKIYFISNMNQDQGYYYWVFRYEATPLKIQEFYYTDNENLLESLNNFDYLYLKDFDENLPEKYSKIFENQIQPNNFYKIEKIDNEIKLKKMESR